MILPFELYYEIISYIEDKITLHNVLVGSSKVLYEFIKKYAVYNIPIKYSSDGHLKLSETKSSEDIRCIKDIEDNIDLKNFGNLEIDNCEYNDIFHKFNKLRSLTLTNCYFIYCDLSNLPLEKLVIRRCDNLIYLDKFPKTLKDVKIVNCYGLRSFRNLPNLDFLEVSFCNGLFQICNYDHLINDQIHDDHSVILPEKIRTLTILNCRSIDRMYFTGTDIMNLKIIGCSPDILRDLPNSLRTFRLSQSYIFNEEFPVLPENLDQLELYACYNISSVYLNKNLQNLMIDSCNNILIMNKFNEELKTLSLMNCNYIVKLDLPKTLIHLNVYNCNSLVQIKFVNSKLLKMVDIRNNYKL